MNYKYIFLDFGNVLSYPITGNWFITPKFLELVPSDKINYEVLNKTIMDNTKLIGSKMLNTEDELYYFTEVYYNLLKSINIDDIDLANKIAYDFTYENNKCAFYDDVKIELDRLSKKYKLIMLSDNWPCVYKIMKDSELDKYFDKLYVSSEYGYIKQEGIFFDYAVSDYDIKENNALFIDDNPVNLDVAKNKGFDCILMNRDNQNIVSNYRMIKSLKEL